MERKVSGMEESFQLERQTSQSADIVKSGSELRAAEEPSSPVNCGDCGHVCENGREMRRHWERCFIARLEKVVEERKLKRLAAQSATEVAESSKRGNESQEIAILSDNRPSRQVDTAETRYFAHKHAIYDAQYVRSAANGVEYVPSPITYESPKTTTYGPPTANDFPVNSDGEEEIFFDGLFADSPEPAYQLEVHNHNDSDRQRDVAAHAHVNNLAGVDLLPLNARVPHMQINNPHASAIGEGFEMNDFVPTFPEDGSDIEVIGVYPPRHVDDTLEMTGDDPSLDVENDIEIIEDDDWQRTLVNYTMGPYPPENVPPIKRVVASPAASEFSSNPSSSSEEPLPHDNLNLMSLPEFQSPDIEWGTEFIPTSTVETGDPNRVYCEVCGKSISRRHFSVHYSMHINKKPFKCEYCDQCFRTTSSRTVHERKHTGERPYQCSFCPYKTITRNNLNRHRFNIHYLETAPTLIMEEPPILQRQKQYRAAKLRPKALAKAERDRQQMVPIGVSGEKDIRVAIL